MKKGILLFMIIFIGIQYLQAQTLESFKPFKINLGIGHVIDFSRQGGIIINFEPGYTIANHYKLGVNLEYAHRYMKTATSVVYTFDYYLNQSNRFRLFGGVGLGNYTMNEDAGCGGGPSTVLTVRKTNPTGEKFRIGFESGHFRLAFEYNLIQKTYVSDLDGNGKTLATVAYDNAYAGIKLGVNIGGGLKKQVK